MHKADTIPPTAPPPQAGRDQHVGIKATAETRDRLYKAADQRSVPFGELVRLCLDTKEATDVLSEIALAREVALPELVKQLVDAAEKV